MISLANQKDILLIHNAMKVTDVDLFNLKENNVEELHELSKNVRARNEIHQIRSALEIHA